MYLTLAKEKCMFWVEYLTRATMSTQSPICRVTPFVFCATIRRITKTVAMSGSATFTAIILADLLCSVRASWYSEAFGDSGVAILASSQESKMMMGNST